MANTFDTLTAAKDLQAAGIDRDQAEAIAKAIREAQGDLVTKPDLRSELNAAITSLERRLIGYGLALAGLVIAVIKLL